MPPHQAPATMSRSRSTALFRMVALAGLLCCLGATAELAEAQPMAETAGAPAKGGEEVIQGIAWLKQQPATNYTLQLMAAATAKPLHTFARSHSLNGPLVVAATLKQEKFLYLLLQGSYISHSEAARAASEFEQQTGERPWIRSFASLPELFDSGSLPALKSAPIMKASAVMGAAWLWSRNPEHYTLQLMGEWHAERLQAFVDSHQPPAPLAIVRTLRDGKPWYVLVSGDYASEGEAASALAAMSSKMDGRGPWLRHFAALHDQMVSANHASRPPAGK